MKRNKVKKMLALVSAGVIAASILAGCGSNNDTATAGGDSIANETEAVSAGNEAGNNEAAEEGAAGDIETAVTSYLDAQQEKYGWKLPDWYEAADETKLEMAELSPEDLAAGKVLSHKDASLFSEVSSEQASELSSEGLKAVLCMRWTGSFWPNQQIKGITDQLDEYGIDVIATTDANSDEATQIANIEQAIALKPDVIFIHPVSENAISDVCKKAVDAGIKIVFLDQSANNLEAGVDYVTTVSCDNYLNGMRHADLMAEALEGKEEKNVAIMYYGYEFTATNDRFEGFVTRIAAKYPDINLIAISPFEDATATESVASAMITANPNVNGIYTEWDEPAIGILSAAKSAGIAADDLAITTDLMSDEIVLSLAQGGYIKGISSQDPYTQGVTEAKCAALSLLGETVPAYVEVVPYTVTRDNLAENYEKLVGTKLFDDAVAALEN